MFCVLPAAPDDFPDSSRLSHILELDDEIASINSDDTGDLPQAEKLILISNGLPPIPARLVKRVEDGLFVEMAELLSSYVDKADLNTDDQHTRSRKRPPVLSDIVDWVQCFGMYITIVSRHKPKRVADLLGYQRIIMGASLDCHEGKWLTYDCCFCLKASASNLKQWSTIDITIWNTTFPERAIWGHRPQGPPPYYQLNSNLHQRSTCQNQPLPTRQLICLD